MIQKIPDKYWPAILFVLVISVVFSLQVIRPLVDAMQEYILLYRPALNENTPKITFLPNGGIQLDGPLPTTIELENQVLVIFDTTPDTSRFNDAPRRSVFVAEKELWYKTKDDIKEFDLMEISSDGDTTHIDPVHFGKKVDKYNSIFITILTILVIGSFFLMIWLVAALGGGIGLMVDAFTRGQMSYAQCMNIASLYLFLIISISVFFKKGALDHFLLLFFGYLVLSAVTVRVVNYFNGERVNTFNP